MGLHTDVGGTCTTFITVDSVRPVETPLPLDGTTVTLPYASFLVWSSDRPYADAVLYHVFGGTEVAYTQPQKIATGGANGGKPRDIVLAPRAAYPSVEAVARLHDASAADPFIHGESGRLEVRPYLLPSQNDDPASVLPAKAERTLQITCLQDPTQVTNCLCAGTR